LDLAKSERDFEGAKKLTGVGEVGFLQLVFLHGETLIEDLGRLLSRDADVARDLLIAANAEGSDGETSCREN
jgi:hypothetical protein